MLQKSVFLLLTFLAVAVLSCSMSSLNSLPIIGSGSPQPIAQTKHITTPEGVRCYVCHKDDMPKAAFHKDFGTNCAQCHNQTTWIPFGYAHTQWPLGIHKDVQCNRCHTQMQNGDFTVHQCFGCHHEEAVVIEAHKNRPNFDVNNCIACHKGAETLPVAASN